MIGVIIPVRMSLIDDIDWFELYHTHLKNVLFGVKIISFNESLFSYNISSPLVNIQLYFLTRRV